MAPSVHHSASARSSASGDDLGERTVHSSATPSNRDNGFRHAGPPPEEGPPREGSASEDSEVKKLKPSSLVVSGAAAATASVIGGQLGVAGTVIGAALTSVVSATAIALYTDSVNKGKTTLQKVQVTAIPRTQGAPETAKHSSRTTVRTASAIAEGRDPDLGPDDPTPAGPPRGRRVGKVVLLALAIALIGIVAVFGIQRLIGTELSPGTGQIQRTIGNSDAVSPRGDSSQQEDQRPDTDDQIDPATVPSQDDDGSTDQDQDAPSEDEAPGQEPEAPAPQNDAPSQQPDSPADQGAGSGSGPASGNVGASTDRSSGDVTATGL